jgi:hypothetical protein
LLQKEWAKICTLVTYSRGIVSTEKIISLPISIIAFILFTKWPGGINFEPFISSDFLNH